MAKSIQQAARFAEGLNKAGDKFVGLLGLSDGKLGGVIDGLDVGSMNMSEMANSAKQFGANLAASFTPMKIVTSMLMKAVETFKD